MMLRKLLRYFLALGSVDVPPRDATEDPSRLVNCVK